MCGVGWVPKLFTNLKQATSSWVEMLVLPIEGIPLWYRTFIMAAIARFAEMFGALVIVCVQNLFSSQGPTKIRNLFPTAMDQLCNRRGSPKREGFPLEWDTGIPPYLTNREVLILDSQLSGQIISFANRKQGTPKYMTFPALQIDTSLLLLSRKLPYLASQKYPSARVVQANVAWRTRRLGPTMGSQTFG